MKYFLEIELDNDAFGFDTKEEVKRIIGEAIKRVDLFSFRHELVRLPLRDANGNTVGHHGYENEEGEG